MFENENPKTAGCHVPHVDPGQTFFLETLKIIKQYVFVTHL